MRSICCSTMTEHDINVSYEGHMKIELEYIDNQDIPMSLFKYKASSY